MISTARAFLVVLISILLFGATAPAARAQSVATTSPNIGDGTLVAALGSPYSTDSIDSAVATGDFNGDGLPDLVFGGGLDETLTVFLSTPAGGFEPTPASPIFIGFFGSALVVADFNGDGNLDIAALGSRDLQILLGDGHGGFSLGTRYPVISGSSGTFAIGFGASDFNHDGNVDLVYVNGVASAGTVNVLLGDGTGNFNPAPGGAVSIGPYPSQLTIADFNMDGNPDVAVTLLGANQVSVLLGDGTGRLSTSTNGLVATGLTPKGITHGDFNGDGKVDLAVGNSADLTITVLLGDGTGRFTRVPDSIAGYYPQGLAVGDFDGDGNVDLAVTLGDFTSAGQLTILLGDGKGGFQGGPPFNVTSSALGVSVADFNGDGRLDAAVATEGTLSWVFLGAKAPSALQLMVSPSSTPTVGAPFGIGALSQPLGFRPPSGNVSLQEGSVTVATGTFDLGDAAFVVTLGTAGPHTLVANYAGDFRTNGSVSPPLTVNVAKASQTITFPPIPNHMYGDPPFMVPASSSSDLPVMLTVVSGPATISGNVLTLLGAGTVTVQAAQPGNANYLPALSIEQTFQVAAPLLRIDAVLNAAAYSSGSLAPSSYGVLFGANLAALATAATLGPTLGGTSIQVTDASGHVSAALLYFTSPTQVNFLLPSNLSLGMATLTVITDTGPSATASISIAAVAPGLFSADATGTGVAAGSALRVSADGTQTQLPINSCSGTPLVCTAIPIDLGSDTDTVYLSLYGTGIRGRSALSDVTANIGGIGSQVQYAGAQPSYPGLDQVNLQLNPALRGRGKVEIALSVDGVFANALNVVIQ